MRYPRTLVGLTAALFAAASALPASAHEPWDDGSVPPPPAASPADGYSQNMHLLSTSEHRGGVNSDLAFKGDLAFAGHYGGFRVIDLSDPGEPVMLADVHCNGPQGDVTVYGDLLFLSVDTPQSTEGCEGSRNVTATTEGAFEGIRVFDISDPASPQFLKAVRTDCGSHTNTLVPGENGTAYVYVASYPLSKSGLGPDCQAPFERISVIQVDGKDTAAGRGARVVAEPEIKGIDMFGAAFGAEPAPTGRLLTLDAIEQLLQQNSESLVLVDEAYIDFGGQTAIALVEKYPNLLVVQTLSKSRSLAGMRVGLAVGQPELIEALERIKNSFNSYPLDRVALAGAAAAFADRDYFEQTCNKVIASREEMVRQLSALGFDVLPSAANFVFARHPQQDAGELAAKLREQGVIVRHFRQPRIEQFLRISVGTDEQNAELYTALNAYL